MNTETPRVPFPHGSDCDVTFVRRADTDRVEVDIWSITANGRQYYFQMMKMRRSTGPWVFGSFSSATTGRELWRFRNDVRARRGYKGGSFTFVYDHNTYVLFENRSGVQHVLPFVGFLEDANRVPEVTGTLQEEIIAAYHRQPVESPAPVVDPRRLAAVQAAKAREAAEQRACLEQARVSAPPRRRAFPEVRVGPDAWHLLFFNNILAFMAVPDQQP